ncbi:Hypothetical protein D9617_19g102750 [Elsinoe fawcettii]|nr:Hypothetical protein D9617_19g102750 [Elsinoe fawcettii]
MSGIYKKQVAELVKKGQAAGLDFGAMLWANVTALEDETGISVNMPKPLSLHNDGEISAEVIHEVLERHECGTGPPPVRGKAAKLDAQPYEEVREKLQPRKEVMPKLKRPSTTASGRKFKLVLRRKKRCGEVDEAMVALTKKMNIGGR